jgi:hypothetical protein
MVYCSEINCKKLAYYNLLGLKEKFCGLHKHENMIDVKTKNCAEVGCRIRANYNIEGQKPAIYCKTHKRPEMVDVRSKKCSENGCKIIPNFNNEGEKHGIYCSEHKKNGMINILSKKCEDTGCKTHAGYNFEGLSGKYCKTHMLDGMSDVFTKRCAEDGCSTKPRFNRDGETAGLYCKEHSLDDMIDVSTPRCSHSNCKIHPKFNVQGKKNGLFCEKHKTEMMVNVKSKRCLTHMCDTQVTNKYEGYCLRCFVHTFPDKPVSRNYKTKERATVDTVLEKFPDISWVCDKTIQDGCSKKRPDIRGDMGSHIVIIEIDENHHSLYDCSCENKRVMEISQDVGHRPIVFIRFNPDDYTDINNNKITSCWGTNKYGILTVKPTKKDEWQERIKVLHEQIQYWIENVPEKNIETIQLFY